MAWTDRRLPFGKYEGSVPFDLSDEGDAAGRDDKAARNARRSKKRCWLALAVVGVPVPAAEAVAAGDESGHNVITATDCLDAVADVEDDPGELVSEPTNRERP